MPPHFVREPLVSSHDEPGFPAVAGSRFQCPVEFTDEPCAELPDFRELRNFEDDPFADAYILEPLAARLRQEFTSHPLVANQLAAKLYLLTYAVSQVDVFDPISHHYFLASTMKELLESARDAAGMPLTGRRTERWPWCPEQVYADDTGLLDFLYRNMCAKFSVQPCVDIRRVM